MAIIHKIDSKISQFIQLVLFICTLLFFDNSYAQRIEKQQQKKENTVAKPIKELEKTDTLKIKKDITKIDDNNSKNSIEKESVKYYVGIAKDIRDAVLDIDPRIRRNYFKGAKIHTNDSSLIYYKKALNYIEVSKDEYFLPQLYILISNYYNRRQNFEEANYYINKCLIYSKKNNSTHFLYLGNYALANWYSRQRINNKAVEHFNEALKYTTDFVNQVKIKCGLTALYINDDYYDLDKTKRYQVAKSIIDEVLVIEKMDLSKYSVQKRFKLKAYLVYGYTYSSTIEPIISDKINISNKAIALARKINYKYKTKKYILVALNNAARINYESDNLNLAIKQSKELIEMGHKDKSTYHLCNGYILMIKILNQKKQYNELLKYADSLSLYTPTIEQTDDLKSILFKANFENKKFEQAAIYANERFKTLDSVFNNKKNQSYLEYGKKYQTEKKDSRK